MSRNNTGNPIDSKAFPDFEDNVKNLDLAVNAEQDTFQDRLGKSRLTWTGIVKAGSGDPAIAVDAAARAESAASQVEQNAEQIAQDAAQQAVDSVVIAVDGAVDRSENAADRAESASDAAFVNADVYPDVASGLAAVADGDQFQVLSEDGNTYIRYQRNGDSALEVGRIKSEAGIDAMVEISSGDTLATFLDADGRPYAVFDRDGRLILSGLDSSVQELLNREGVPERSVFETSPDSLLFEIRDAGGRVAAAILNSGALVVSDVVLPEGRISDLISDNPEREITPTYDAFMFSDGGRASLLEPENAQHVFIDYTDIPTENPEHGRPFGPCITRLSRNEFFFVCDARQVLGDDFEPIDVVGRRITYIPEDKTFSKGPVITLAANGTTGQGVPYSFMNPTVTYVEKGPNAGRILVHMNYMDNPANVDDRVYIPYYLYSDDGGETFTPPIDLSSSLPLSEWGGTLLGPGHGIQIRKGPHAGRIIIPGYHLTPEHPVIRDQFAVAVFSDDGGDTFSYGSDLPLVGLNEWQVAEDWSGKLVAMCRRYSSHAVKFVAYSTDGGETFSEPFMAEGILGAGTKVGFNQCANPYDLSAPKLVAICASDGTDADQWQERIDPTAWVSYDSGKTWPFKYKVASGICQYTECVPLDENHVLILYGGGIRSRGETIFAHVVSIKNLLGG